ncbi:MAG TPA: M23 family metallopeptidase [Polyangiaceae bacterium]|jgi:murein DD-endopeptidase MepM/ murein hydrolase activator NlpD
MKAAALTLAAFAGFPGSSAPPHLLPQATPVGWADSWMLQAPDLAGLTMALPSEDALSPEASASDEVAADLVEDGDELPRVVLVGCELALSGQYTPESWAREIWIGAPLPTVVDNGHTERDGSFVSYEAIPRRVDRPEAYAAYRYPVADAPVVSGFDLDKPDDEQRRGKMHAVGHGGVDLVAAIGTPIQVVRLDHQVGDAEVLYVGPLYGETVVTRHIIREGGSSHDYLLLFGHLDHAADDVRRGRRLHEGATLGYVGNTDSPQLVHLHLEARRVRDGIDAWRLPGDALHAREFSVVADPRNLLPLLATRPRAARCAPRLPPVTRRYWLGDSLTLAIE